MPRRKSVVFENSNSEGLDVNASSGGGLVEGDSAVTQKAKPRITLPLTIDGKFDFASMRDGSKKKLVEAIANDPDAFKQFGIGAIEVASSTEGPIKDEHVALLLTGYEYAERIAIPKYIEKQSKGLVKLSPELAAQAFSFSQQQREKLCPAGAKWLNQILPEKIKDWIAKGGPGAEFLMGLAFATHEQTKVALTMWKESQSQVAPNGHASEQPPRIIEIDESQIGRA